MSELKIKHRKPLDLPDDAAHLPDPHDRVPSAGVAVAEEPDPSAEPEVHLETEAASEFPSAEQIDRPMEVAEAEAEAKADEIRRVARPASRQRLRLRKLIAHGFKSFADRTEFVFDKPIVGVVGPNGCGKSNVVDAFKWVLGEQSAKSLRGEAMLDVIFNGAAGRQPGSFAEVVLVFSNPADEDGVRPLMLDVDEVSVGRQLLRDGTSHYRLNGKNARLKDVRDLFMDTGVGVDAYSVIEQGRVSQMLEASSAERRTIFEEAAGISRFKQKKKEAQRKLERVEQNLLRLTDIAEEVERRLRGVKIAAGKARNYQELSQQLWELRLKSALHDYHELTTRRTTLEKEQADAQFELDDVAGDLQRLQNKLAEQRQEAERLGEARRQAEYSLVQTRGKIDQARQRFEYASQQIGQVEQQAGSLAQEQEETQRLAAENTAALEQDQKSLEEATEQLAAAQARIEERHAEHRQAQLQAVEVNRALEATKGAILEAMNKLSSAERRLSNIEIEKQTVDERTTRLRERFEQVTAEQVAAESRRSEHQRRLDEVIAEIGTEQALLDQKRSEAASVGQSINRIGEQLVEAREHRSALVSRRKLLEDLEARREGVGEGVQQVLRERETAFGFIRGLVADLLRVDVEHAPVVEAALDGRDQWLIAEPDADLEAAREAFAALPGRVNVLIRRSTGFRPVTISSDHGQDARVTTELAQRLTAEQFDWNRFDIPIRFAIDLVQFDPSDHPLAELLLGRTVVTQTLADALALRSDGGGPPGIRYVTRAGEVIEADGTFKAGPPGASMGILSRRSELAQVVHQIADADASIASLQSLLARESEQSRKIEEALNAVRERIYDLNGAKVESGEKLSAEQDRVSALARELPSIEAELAELQAKLDRLAAEQAQREAQRDEVTREQANREATVAELAEKQKVLGEQIAAASENLTAARVAMGQVQEQQIAARRGVERHTGRQRELSQQLDRIAASVATLETRRHAAEEERSAAETDRRRCETQAGELQSQVEAHAATLDAARQEVNTLAEAVDDRRERHDQAEDAVRNIHTALTELTVRLESLVQRAAEETDLDLPAQYAEASEQEGSGGGYVPEDEDWDAIAAAMKELRGRIQRLGNVNLDAIGEQEQLEERHNTLAEQMGDLNRGKSQLEELIETINRESGQRFEETFNVVRDHFQGMFRKLFGGGKADIFLQTEIEEKHRTEEGKYETTRRKVDVLEAGIEIVARPPGKQPVSISQLSGGEKTMTCVALLMSIFKSKPSPFCILDEVDAALDEANNVRFNRIVEEFLGESQFIVITHSKRTMQIADVLYGVTMQEQGVSKKVAVRFDQVAEGGRIKAEAAA